VSQTVNGVTTRYLLDMQPELAYVLAATTGANTVRYVHGATGIHAQQDSAGAWDWMVQDGLGSVRGVVDNTLAVQESRMYDPYGNPFGVVGTNQTVYGFTGEQTDENKLLHLRKRYMNPALGAFISLDPFEGVMQRPMSLNGYSWVEGNTVNATDASGAFASLNSANPLALLNSLNSCSYGSSLSGNNCVQNCAYAYAFDTTGLLMSNCLATCNRNETLDRRNTAVQATLAWLQAEYGAFPNPNVYNPENEDCEFNPNRRGLNEFVALSDKVAELTNSVDDYLYVMNTVLLRYESSGDFGTVVSVGTSRSWANGFCIGSEGLSHEYWDGTQNQISTHAWSFVATSASQSSRIGTIVGIGGNILHDVIQGMLHYEGASWQDYILSYTSMMLGQRLRQGEISPAQFGAEFREAVGGTASYWDFIGCDECRQMYGEYYSDWAQREIPIGPR
jgi:RHS repeat-associated protein